MTNKLFHSIGVLTIVPALFIAAFSVRTLIQGSDCQISLSIH
ncbi:MAG: hypothetical protein UDB11_02995 [Peptococcaceae bacterium]|nr:hypothetical protein [Peptococcaceae bacterium]